MNEVEGSTTLMAAVNLAKLCIGSGLLAIPYSFLRGGLLFSPLVIGLIAFWNGLSCYMIIRCKNACLNEDYPNYITSTYSKIAYSAFGNIGCYITDFSLIFTLLGICISYQIAFASLLQEIPNIIFNHQELAVISGLLVIPMCIAKDISIITSFSLLSLFFLFTGIISIFIFGIILYGNDLITNKSASILVTLWPNSISDITSFLGVSIFCFGTCTLAFPVEETMKNKNEFNKAVLWSLVFVWIVYFIVGDGIILLYKYDSNSIKSNIIQNLPTNSFIATLLRITMASVCLLGYPIVFNPPANMIESMISNKLKSYMIKPNIYQYQYQSITKENEMTISYELPLKYRIINRVLLVAYCTVCSSFIPCFGVVVSLLGCFTVTILSFILPPLLHLQIVSKPLIRQTTLLQHHNTPQSQYLLSLLHQDRISPKNQLVIDYIIALLGIFMCVIATYITIIDSINKLSTNGSC